MFYKIVRVLKGVSLQKKVVTELLISPEFPYINWQEGITTTLSEKWLA